MKRVTRTAFLSVSVLALVSAWGLALAGCRALPPVRPEPIPRLQLGQTSLRMVLRAYGLPRVGTPNQLWYVGPEPTSLAHGADGWMTLLTFDNKGVLRSQESLARGPAKGYLHVVYRVKGDLAARDRENDLDRLMILRAGDLAQQDANYHVTFNEPDMFVLARLLPSENEPVFQWRASGEGAHGEVEMTIDALPARDEPLMDRINGAIGQRMLLIHVTLDKEAHPSAIEGAP